MPTVVESFDGLQLAAVDAIALDIKAHGGRGDAPYLVGIGDDRFFGLRVGRVDSGQHAKRHQRDLDLVVVFLAVAPDPKRQLAARLGLAHHINR
jgi:hypothetical protein